MYHPSLLSLDADVWCSGPPARPQAHPLAPGPTGIDAAPPLRVLIVEDEVMIAMTLEAMVEDFGYLIGGIASNGEEAVRQAPQAQPDVILMDINLGSGIDGVEAARRIRTILAARLVFVTAYSDPATLARIRAVAPDALVVNKPFDSDALRRAIEGTARQ